MYHNKKYHYATIICLLKWFIFYCDRKKTEFRKAGWDTKILDFPQVSWLWKFIRQSQFSVTQKICWIFKPQKRRKHAGFPCVFFSEPWTKVGRCSVPHTVEDHQKSISFLPIWNIFRAVGDPLFMFLYVWKRPGRPFHVTAWQLFSAKANKISAATPPSA